MSPSQTNWPFIINVGNSIIGVTVLAMPFCFKACGIILATLMLFFSTWLTVVSCQLLMKAGVTARRRSFSLLAYYTHGATGKLIVEIGMIGLQLGTLIAQVVIIGDLGPAIVSKATGLQNTNGLRTGLILFLCLFIGLPLALLKDLRTLSKTSSLCIAFYTFFTVYVVLLSLPSLIANNWYQKVNLWRFEGFFQCLPIFSFAFGCQTQLFIVYDALADPSLKRINSIVNSAVNMCTVCYLLVGFFGYIAFSHIEELSGDIINHFQQNAVCDMIKLCFVVSIAVSIPLIVFPCRASLFTLLFPQKPKDDMPGSGKIPELHFFVITGCIVCGSMVLGILIPNIEFVLGLNGATMGTLICYIFPAMFFLNVMSDSSEKKSTGRLVLFLGLTIMIASTYTTLNAPTAEVKLPKAEPIVVPKDIISAPPKNVEDSLKQDNKLLDELNNKPPDGIGVKEDKDTQRHEPPIPQEPDDDDKTKLAKAQESVKELKSDNKDIDDHKAKENVGKDIDEGQKEVDKDQKEGNDNDQDKNADEKKAKDIEGEKRIAVDGAKDTEDAHADVKPAEEKKAEENRQQEVEKKQEEILAKLEQRQEEAEKLLQEQRQILEELKEHKEKHKEQEAQEEVQNKQVDSIQAGQNVIGQGQPANQNINLQGQPLNNQNIQGQLNIQNQGQQNNPQGQIQLDGQGLLNNQDQGQQLDFQGQNLLNNMGQIMNQGQGQQLNFGVNQLNNQPLPNIQAQQGQNQAFNQGQQLQGQQLNLQGQNQLLGQAQQANILGQNNMNLQGQAQINVQEQLPLHAGQNQGPVGNNQPLVVNQQVANQPGNQIAGLGQQNLENKDNVPGGNLLLKDGQKVLNNNQDNLNLNGAGEANHRAKRDTVGAIEGAKVLKPATDVNAGNAGKNDDIVKETAYKVKEAGNSVKETDKSVGVKEQSNFVIKVTEKNPDRKDADDKEEDEQDVVEDKVSEGMNKANGEKVKESKEEVKEQANTGNIQRDLKEVPASSPQPERHGNFVDYVDDLLDGLKVKINDGVNSGRKVVVEMEELPRTNMRQG